LNYFWIAVNDEQHSKRNGNIEQLLVSVPAFSFVCCISRWGIVKNTKHTICLITDVLRTRSFYFHSLTNTGVSVLMHSVV